MDIATLSGLDERHPVYQAVASANHDRLMDFLRSMVSAAGAFGQPMTTHHLIRSLNAHAIAGLHSAAGQYRSTSVAVGPYVPPEPERVRPLMDNFLTELAGYWETTNASPLGAWALWRINSIHPFVNGNGRTARALCYYIICVKFGTWLPGTTLLPNLLKQYSLESVGALQQADAGNLQPLTDLVSRLLMAQMNAPSPPP